MSCPSILRLVIIDSAVAIVSWVSSVYCPLGKPGMRMNSFRMCFGVSSFGSSWCSNGAPKASPTAVPMRQPKNRSSRVGFIILCFMLRFQIRIMLENLP